MFEAFVLGRWKAVLKVTLRRYETETAATYQELLTKMRKRRRPKRALIYETA